MELSKRLNIALLVMRLGIGAFLLVWASLKFFRPEWMVNVFRNTYGLGFVAADYAYVVGTLQLCVVLLFIVGLWRTPVYGFVTIMHGTGVVGSLLNGSVLFKGGLIKALSTGVFEIGYTRFPANLLWTSVATLAALIALFMLRHDDGFTVDGFRNRKAVSP